MTSTSPVRFAAVGLDHAHIHGQIAGLIKAGAEFVAMATDDPSSGVAHQVRERYPDVPYVDDGHALIARDDLDLIVTAAIPDQRGPIAVAALRSGKDVVADKPGCVTHDQLEEIEKAVAESGRFWSVTFSERFEVASAVKAGHLVREGRIGTVVQTIGLGPHRIGDRGHLGGNAGRPDWFYEKERYGGILADIASHQIDQFLWYTDSRTAEVVTSSVGNFANPDKPGLQDFGDLLLRSDHAQGYIRVDWYTPAGLGTWGDGRLMILGTEGYIELRKYVDIAGRDGGNHLFVVDGEKTEYIDCSDVELTYYPDLVRDVRDRTTTAAPQEHTFETMRLALTAQQNAAVRGAAQ
ncbi:Gfo/Idh/MocA family protein [Kribbella italica]|uniref:Putative dehydrogenase n=1 Tax=Kribbella italica TaxID=1540520 RepID=A0A7W9J7P9_9ACTN|nr:Gfo/Idh/MocA family oxidoreductase [Kribbella italica]MBB5837053.1 putative dehydrogenase [Kribbella italica]